MLTFTGQLCKGAGYLSARPPPPAQSPPSSPAAPPPSVGVELSTQPALLSLALDYSVLAATRGDFRNKYMKLSKTNSPYGAVAHHFLHSEREAEPLASLITQSGPAQPPLLPSRGRRSWGPRREPIGWGRQCTPVSLRTPRAGVSYPKSRAQLSVMLPTPH